MYNTLALLVILALMCQPDSGHDKSQLKKMVLKLHKKTSPKLQKEILKPIIEASDIRAEAWRQIDYFYSMIEHSQQLSEEGYAGILVVDRKVIYPIRIHVPDAFERCDGMVGAKYVKAAEKELLEDREWIIQEEMKIKTFCVNQCADMLGDDTPLFEISLFSNRGFTGIQTPFIFEQKRQKRLTYTRKSA